VHFPETHPHAFASIESHCRSCVHIVSGFRGSAFVFAMHAFAWHAVAGAQSSSLVHVSFETAGVQS